MILLGSTGPYVAVWNRILGVRPHNDQFNAVTDVRCRAWQRARGIDPDGVIGPLTRSVLQPGDLIKPYEGCVLRAYDDAQNAPLSKRYITHVSGSWKRLDGTACQKNPTIGWGRRLYDRVIETCTQAEADRWFTEDIEQTRMPAVRRAESEHARLLGHPVKWDAGQVAAACSFAYNAGTGALASLAQHLFSADVWRSYYHSGSVPDSGLLTRRLEEIGLWSGDVEPPTA